MLFEKGLILTKSKIGLSGKEKLFLKLNNLLRINTLKIRHLSEDQLRGIEKRYSSFLTIIDMNDEIKEIIKEFKSKSKQDVFHLSVPCLTKLLK
jgi:hypothetical protein